MIYVHTPFCSSKCIYCDFNTYAGLEELVDDYTLALVIELKARSELSRKIGTIYFGGGNPLKLGIDNLTAIMGAVRRYYNVDIDAEISLEANPEDVDKNLLARCGSLGFNRLSLGFQSFDDAQLIFLRRRHTARAAMDAYQFALDAGFKNINIDLIFGLPGQSVSGWRRELEVAKALEPNHISTYGLSVETGTPLYKGVNEGDVSLPAEDDQALMMEDAHDLLSDYYHHYEISNFAKDGFECRHNLNYWRARDYLGFGAGAYSCLNGRRFFNEREPSRYIKAAFKNSKLIEEVEVLNERQRLAESIFLGLRLTDGFKVKDLDEKFACSLRVKFRRELGKWSAHGLLEIDDYCRLTARGRLLANEVMSDFV